MTPFARVGILLLVLFAGGLILTQCTGKKTGKDRITDQSKTGEILKARTMGLAYLEENELEKAEAEFLKLVSLAPSEAIGFANLGLVYMRMGRYEESEENLLKAIELSPMDADIRLNLATLYKYRNEDEKSLAELEEIIEIEPGHVQSLYLLAESYSGSTDTSSMRHREKYLKKTVETSPANIVPRLQLIEILLRNDKTDEALSQLEEVQRVFPEFPDEAEIHYNEAMEAMHASNTENALTCVRKFHNYLKLTNPYQNGITELKGYEGRSMGVPVFTLSDRAPLLVSEGGSILDALRFTDVTQSAGLGLISEGDAAELAEEKSSATHLAVGDFNHDGAEDLYLGTYLPGTSDYHHYLFKSEMGRFKDVADDAGLDHRGEESQATFADYDNDGWFDLLVLNEGSPVLYKSISEGKYENRTRKAIPGKIRNANRGLFFDADHEGDLDLFLAISGQNSLLRNNADGTFTENAEESGLAGGLTDSRDACFGDFDDDGDIDLLVVNRNAECVLYSNIREGKFRDNTPGSGLQGITDAIMVTAGDYNNDGYLDIFLAGPESDSFRWYRNTNKGKFERDHPPEALLESINHLTAHDATFLDFDNDGYLDLLISGESGMEGSPGASLLHNDGTGSFDDVSHLLPPDLEGGRQIALADYNADGDLDIFLAGLNGGVRLLRNDGGNANHHLKMRLVGVRTGSGKNNHYGIGAKIELRAGDLYQMKVVTDPNIHFGLADRSEVDVVRILWTNGTPQNIFTPGIEQDLVEQQELKGSCPFLYTWNGSEYVFVKDIMWRSALGMPMGIMGEQKTYAFADASEDYHKIPGDMLKPSNGTYSIQVTGELWETIYFDEARLVVVDHPDSVDIYVDEKFVAPPYPQLEIFSVSGKHLPLSASDGYGNDLLDLVSKKDNRYVSNFKRDKYQGITETRELILDPGDRLRTDRMFLFLNGWIFPTDASINMALSQGENVQVIPPYLQVINPEGDWETVIDNIGFPQGKDKTVIADLSGKFLSGDHRIRILTNMEIYWDYIFFSSTCENAPLRTVYLDPVAADHHYRGFSRMYRKGGRNGPHWFDYSTVSYEPRWRDLTGNYTRYGDVRELLREKDDMYIITNAGEETTIEFDAAQVDKLPEGWSRDYLIYSVGWVKDGDMNTAEGNRVEPLPFHGMTAYPYDESQSYPDDRTHKRFLKKYITREVTTEEFRRAVYNYQ